MPRIARTKSESGIYHVMLRGINQTQLFYDDDDRKAFIEVLERYRHECRFKLYAYSLMGNHVHLLLKEEGTGLADIIKRIALSYSARFNRKYERNGYLFQGRYKSGSGISVHRAKWRDWRRVSATVYLPCSRRKG
jgi:REP element-mobilizing transposase RayT